MSYLIQRIYIATFLALSKPPVASNVHAHFPFPNTNALCSIQLYDTLHVEPIRPLHINTGLWYHSDFAPGLNNTLRIVEDTGGRMFGLDEHEVMARRQYVTHVRSEIEVGQLALLTVYITSSAFVYSQQLAFLSLLSLLTICSSYRIVLYHICVEGQNMRFELLPPSVCMPFFLYSPFFLWLEAISTTKPSFIIRVWGPKLMPCSPQ